MQSVPFPIRRVNRLRRAAEQARLVPAKPFDGWSACACEADKLMHVFDTLWVKAGFALHAYAILEGCGGNGIIWAVPADARLIAPKDRPRLEDTWLRPPQPPGAVRLMQAIEGDGSP